MPEKVARLFVLLTGLVLLTSIVHAGGVDPRDMPPTEPVKQEKVTATPAQTSAAVSKARRVVAPEAEKPRPAPAPKATPKPVPRPAPKAATTAKRDSWRFSPKEGGCLPLADVSGKVKDIGTFRTPQEFALQMRQRGYQAFVLDIGEVADQKLRVKVPDRDLDLMFVREPLCR